MLLYLKQSYTQSANCVNDNYSQSLSFSLSLHALFKAEHTAEVSTLIIVFFVGFRIMRIRMMAVEKLDDMEPAFVDIEMDVPRFKVGSTRLPDFCFRIQAFNFLPGSIAYTFAVCCWRDKQQVQMVMLRLFIYRQYHPAYNPAIFPDTVLLTS